MKFVIAIEPCTDITAWGVAVPDLPGCYSAGDTLDEAFDNAREAIDLFCQVLIEDKGQLPIIRGLDAHQHNPEFAGWIWGVVDVPVERLLGPAEKINITLPRIVLARIDDFAKARGESRSGLLTRAALQVITADAAGRQDEADDEVLADLLADANDAERKTTPALSATLRRIAV